MQNWNTTQHKTCLKAMLTFPECFKDYTISEHQYTRCCYINKQPQRAINLFKIYPKLALSSSMHLTPIIVSHCFCNPVSRQYVDLELIYFHHNEEMVTGKSQKIRQKCLCSHTKYSILQYKICSSFPPFFMLMLKSSHQLFRFRKDVGFGLQQKRSTIIIFSDLENETKPVTTDANPCTIILRQKIQYFTFRSMRYMNCSSKL